MTGQIFVLSRDRVIFSVRFSSVVQNVLDVEVGDPLPRNYVNYEFCRRGIPVSKTQEQTLELNTCVRTVAPEEEHENQDTSAVSNNY